MLKDQLLLVIVLQDQRKPVKAPNAPAQLDSANQINRDHSLFFAGSIQKCVLNILSRLLAMVLFFHSAGDHVLFPSMASGGSPKAGMNGAAAGVA